MYKIGIVDQIHEDGIKILKDHPKFEYEIIKDISKKNLIKELPKFDGLALRLTKLDEEILSACKKLKVISRHGVGYDNVNTNFLKKNNIKLLITATANAVTVAEHVMFMLLNISKGKTLYDDAVRSGFFKENVRKNDTFELYNKTVLIVGFGRIGKILVKRFLGFEMKVKVFDPFVNENIIKSFGAVKIEDLKKTLSEIDVVTLHVPLNEKTNNLFDINVFKNMKKNSVIINTSRGGIINEKDLDKALNDRIIFAAGLDVFLKEPIEKNNPLLKNKNVLLSPHASTLTKECILRTAKETIQNLIDFFENKTKNEMVVKL